MDIQSEILNNLNVLLYIAYKIYKNNWVIV